jgi:hypothetical protein
MHPLPPSPAFTLIFASSMNIKSKSLDPKARPYVWRGLVLDRVAHAREIT